MKIGKVSLTMRKPSKVTTDVTLYDVLLVPGMKVNLFSTTRAAVQGSMTIIVNNKTIQLKTNSVNGKTVIVSRYSNSHKLFVLDYVTNPPKLVENRCFSA